MVCHEHYSPTLGSSRICTILYIMQMFNPRPHSFLEFSYVPCIVRTDIIVSRFSTTKGHSNGFCPFVHLPVTLCERISYETVFRFNIMPISVFKKLYIEYDSLLVCIMLMIYLIVLICSITIMLINTVYICFSHYYSVLTPLNQWWKNL